MDQTGHHARESGDADISRNDPLLTASVNTSYETLGCVDCSRVVGSFARISRADAWSWLILDQCANRHGIDE